MNRHFANSLIDNMTEEDAKSFIEWLFARCNLTISPHNYMLHAYDKKTKNECFVTKHHIHIKYNPYKHISDYIWYGTSPANMFRYAIDQMFSGYDIIACGISMPIRYILRASTSLEEMLVKYDLEKDIYAQQ